MRLEVKAWVQDIKALQVRQKIMLSALLMALVLFFLSYTYGDILVTTRHAMIHLENIFSGNFFGVYTLPGIASGNMFHATEYEAFYNILVYTVFAIWSIPLVLAENLLQIDVMNNYICLLWMKLLLMVALAISVWTLYKIADALQYTKLKKYKLSFLYLSSMFVIAPIFITAQYDILGLCFILLAVLEYMREHHKKFLFYIAVAACFKSFALLTLLLLVLLKEKRVMAIIRDCLVGSSLWVVTQGVVAIYRLANEYEASKTQAWFVEKLLSVTMGDVIPVVLALTVLYIMCYLNTSTVKSGRNQYMIWYCFSVLAVFCVIGQTHSYWVVLVAPFLALLLCENTKLYAENLMLEIIMSVTLVATQILEQPWCFLDDTLKPMLFGRLLGTNTGEAYTSTMQTTATLVYEAETTANAVYTNIADTEVAAVVATQTDTSAVDSLVSYLQTQVDGFSNVLMSISIAALIIMMIINYPTIYGNMTKKREVRAHSDVLALRLVCFIGLGLAPIALFIVMLLL